MTRATVYREDIFASILDQIEDGVPLKQICRQEGMPCARTVWNWMENNPEIAARVKQARDDGWDAIAYRCREIARGKAGSDTTGDVKRDKLIVETDLKLLAKWDPKRYGDRIEHSGTITHNATDLDTMLTQLVTQVTMNPTLRPVLESWATKLIDRLKEA